MLDSRYNCVCWKQLLKQHAHATLSCTGQALTALYLWIVCGWLCMLPFMLVAMPSRRSSIAFMRGPSRSDTLLIISSFLLCAGGADRMAAAVSEFGWVKTPQCKQHKKSTKALTSRKTHSFLLSSAA